VTPKEQEELLEAQARVLEAASTDVAVQVSALISRIAASAEATRWGNLLPLVYGTGAMFLALCNGLELDPADVLANMAEVKAPMPSLTVSPIDVARLAAADPDSKS
jgi:hypothetical protein